MSRSDTNQAYFLIADISGYPKFMAEAEIQHAKGILDKLFGAILPIIREPLEVSSPQGDAIFSYALVSDAVGGQYLLDIADTVYAAFRDSRDKIETKTSCTCSACKAIGDLELKVVIHHGECVLQDADGRKELAGKDVINAFRLLKNRVKQKAGLSAYTLVTREAVEQMGVPEIFAEAAHYTEEIEHIGEVDYVVTNLREAWERKRERALVIVEEDDEQLLEEWLLDIPASPQIVFTACSRRDLREYWMGADKIDLVCSSGGRVEEGSQYHCCHGRESFRVEIVDWRVGEHITMEYKLPFGMACLETMSMQPVDIGTRFRLRMHPLRTNNVIGKMMVDKANRDVIAMHNENIRLSRLGALNDLCIQLQEEAETPEIDAVEAAAA
jgi:uncharacterized protein YndB with AHSA1/START domain